VPLRSMPPPEYFLAIRSYTPPDSSGVRSCQDDSHTQEERRQQRLCAGEHLDGSSLIDAKCYGLNIISRDFENDPR